MPNTAQAYLYVDRYLGEIRPKKQRDYRNKRGLCRQQTNLLIESLSWTSYVSSMLG